MWLKPFMEPQSSHSPQQQCYETDKERREYCLQYEQNFNEIDALKNDHN